jgi:hypothetical protein
VITTALLRADLPEFSDSAKYTDPVIVYWLRFAALLINQARWGAPSPLNGVAVAIAVTGNGGAGYAVNDLLTVQGGIGSQATQLVVDAVNAGVITAAHATTFGNYQQLPQIKGATVLGGAGNGATFDLGYQYGSPSTYDFGQELHAAHNLVLERRAQDEAAKGNVPGWSKGAINNVSVDKASVGYDPASTIEPEAGHWNLTIYGQRFIRLLRQMGSGGLQIGVGFECFGATVFSGPPVFNIPNGSG